MASQSVASAPAAGAPFSIRAILAPLAAIVLGTFMAILDNTVVNVALPTLVRVFHSDLHTIQWVVTAYMLAQAAVIPLSGWLADRFGAKRLYLACLALFTIGSMLCAAAPSGPMLVVFRILQGLGGGMLMPTGMSFLYRLAPPDKRGAVMGAFGIPILLAPALGPTMSGYLVQYADWRWIFLINVPIGIIAVLVGLRALPALQAQRTPGALDTIGAILAPLGFASVSYGISESANSGWTSTSTLAGLAVGLTALVLFGVRELTTAHPLLELRVFRSVDFSLGIVTQWIGQAALFGAMFLLPLFLQQVRGYGAFDTGLFTLPQALAAAAFMPVGGRLFDRFGARPTVLAGMVLVAISTFWLSHLSLSTTGEDLRLPLAMRGAGMGLFMMPLNTHLLNAAPRSLVSRVTSLTSALQNVVGSLAIATLATILQNRTTAHFNADKPAIAAYTRAAIARATAAARHAAGASGVPTMPKPGHGTTPVLPRGVGAAIQQYQVHAFKSAFTAAFNDTFTTAATLAVVGVVLALTLRRQHVGSVAEPVQAGAALEAGVA